ncbi:Ig-like domain-containing protein [Gloeobacter morelensis]|uniref:Uncharacterized protein n=1 Tax=Gloeobacter morelensis MG652769 TaxID=2781736 RepID=A0ABY3PP35_9CYAN|nr:hypothetical protein [Gloeobacter morelensis]UFP95394.1 hypothetical protein ISF26_03850 [Gloeobacter morelensis MG652769]
MSEQARLTTAPCRLKHVQFALLFSAGVFFVNLGAVQAETNQSALPIPAASGFASDRLLRENGSNTSADTWKIAQATAITLSGIGNGQVLPPDSVIYVEAKVSGSKPSEVQFLLDGKIVGTEYVSPYFLGGDNSGKPNGWSLNGLANGSHTLQAKAIVSGSAYTSSTVSFSVGAASSAVTVNLSGLSDGQSIAETSKLFVEATISSSKKTKKVDFYIDDRLVWTENNAPYWLGGNSGNTVNGYSVSSLTSGSSHSLFARASVDGMTYDSAAIGFTVSASGGGSTGSSLSWSSDYDTPDADNLDGVSTDDIVGYIGKPSTSGGWEADENPKSAWFKSEGDQLALREAVVDFYRRSGHDLRKTKDQIDAWKPSTWSSKMQGDGLPPYLKPLSIDSYFYKQVPGKAEWPHLLIDRARFKDGKPWRKINFGTTDSDDSNGTGHMYGEPADPVRQAMVGDGDGSTGDCPDVYYNPYSGGPRGDGTVRLKDAINPAVRSGGNTNNGPVTPDNSNDSVVHHVFKESDGSFWETEYYHYRPGCGSYDGDTVSRYGEPINQLPHLGDKAGGYNAAKITGVGGTMHDSELLDNADIGHALMGPTDWIMAALVYPGRGMDGGYQSDKAKGLNQGYLPYGALVRLDPDLTNADIDNFVLANGKKLDTLTKKILRALRDYGWYVSDTGSRDMDIEANVQGDRLPRPRGDYYTELVEFMNAHNQYVVPPPVRPTSDSGN